MDNTSDNQMDRPSTPTDAAAARISPDDKDYVPSLDPPSTRPNPFDDSDLLARKRRRTSGSASPPPSASTPSTQDKTPLSNHISAEATGANHTAFGQQVQDEVVTATEIPELLHTPQAPTFIAPNSSTPLSSSKVTINLRNSNGLALDASEPSSPTSKQLTSPTITDNGSHAGGSIVYAKNEQLPKTNVGTSPKSRSNSTSPPVELISVSDMSSEEGDDKMVFSVDDKAAAIVGHDLPSFDPILQFPYSEPEDDPSTPLHRLLEYLSTHSPIDSKIIAQVQAWIEDHLSFAASSEQSVVLDSRETYKGFWLSFPSVIFQLSARSPELSKIHELRNSVIDLYSIFTCLTARMVALDVAAIRHTQSNRGADNQQCPEIFSARYLHQLYEVLASDACLANVRDEARPAPGSSQHDVGSYLIVKLQSSQGGSVNDLSQLASSIISLVPQFPRLMDALAPVAQMLGACMREAAFTISNNQSGSRVRQANAQLQTGNLAWTHLFNCLELVIEKHVTQLSADTATVLLHALSDMLKCALRGSHQQATGVLQQHTHDFPGLPIAHTIEAIAWKWRVRVLERLIRSSQMQLRVMAITKLCGDLVLVWKSAASSSDEDNARFLEHLGTHLLQTHLVDYIFGLNCHPEIIVESANILGFLIVTKMYKQEHTDRLWQGLTLSQDPRVAEALARMISHITNLLDYDGLLVWCEKFQTLPLEEFSLAMRTLWDNIMEGMLSRCQTEQHPPSFHPYKLCLRLLREASICTTACQTADPELQLAAMQKLKEFFAFGPSPEDRKTLYLSCIDDIAQLSATTRGSLWCLSMAIRNTVPRDLQVLTEQHDLARLVIEELAHAVRAGHQAGAVTVLSGDSNIPRRDMIANIIHFQPSAVNDELGIKLLDILVGPESPCAEDRAAGWLVIINVMKKASLKNTFLQTCFSTYLPDLPASCFSDGMLDFVRERVLSLAGEDSDFALDDSETLSNSGIEQLWRIILEAHDSHLVARAISTLAIDLYLHSNTMRRYSITRAQKVHSSLVTRCLSQMRAAATKMKGSSDDDESMVIVPTDEELQQQELFFRRSLQLLRFFLEKHQAHPKFAVADLRPLMVSAADQMAGSSAELKYQSFDGCEQSSIKPLHIGRDNTVACLLAYIKRETGFENYRIYYRGQQWFPSEHQIGLALHELHIQDEMILVKRDEDISSTASCARPGSSQLEIEILSHFKELWEYLGMEEKLAEDLPADGEFTARFETDNVSHLDIFLKGYPFKTLYAIHAISDYVEAARYQRLQVHPDTEIASEGLGSSQKALERSLRLVVDAISDPEVLEGVSSALRLRIAGSLVQVYVKLFNIATDCTPQIELKSSLLPSATRLYEILCLAEGHDGDPSLTLIDRTCAAILRIGSASPDFWETTVSETNFLETVANLVLKDPRKPVKQSVVELIEDATRAPPKPEEYFRSLLYLLEQTNARWPSATNVEALAVTTLDLLMRHTSIETIDQPDMTDPVATGLTALLHTCLRLDERLVTCAAFDDNIATHLFWRHLFPRKRRGDRGTVPRVVHNMTTRMKLLEIVFLFIECKRTTFRQVLETMNGLVPFYSEEPDDPYMYELPFSFERSKAVRAPCGYVGLRNLSNTCYLNSLLTQLFMNIQFRSFILSIEVEDQGDSQQLLFRTQKLFGYMQESCQRYVDPSAVITSIRTYDDTPIDIHSQMDVDEFYNLLFDRWEGQLPGNDEKKKLRSFFGGQLVQQVKSKECEHISERIEPFSAIQCDIKGKSTLQESLQAYVDGEVMEGENKYKCSTCDRHVDAVKRACLKDVPDNLICHLKRFDFNLRTMQRNKINDYFSFPLSLDISPYTVEYLNANGDAPQSDVFELVGILVHSGTAESGHYYSYIRERGPSEPSTWVEFNDDMVTPWDPSLMESSTFGGTDRQPIHEAANGLLFDRTYSAYMLFYQRASSLRAGLPAKVAASSEHRFSPKIPPPMREHISNENRMLLRRHCLFDPSYTLFVQKCFGHAIHLGESQPRCSQPSDHESEADADTDESPHQLQNLAMELALSHYDQVVTRTKDLPFVGTFSSLLENAITKCYDCAFAFHDYFSMRHSAFRALVQRNPDLEIRRFSGKALLQAVEKIRTGLPRLYYHPRPTSTPFGAEVEEDDEDWAEPDVPTSVVQGTIDLFNHLWRFFHVHIRSWDEYFAIVLRFAKLGDLEVGYLLGENYLLKLLRIINADPMIDQPVNYQRMVTNLLRRFASKPASYVSILALIDYFMSQLEPILSAEVIVEEAGDRRGSRRPFAWTSDEVQAIHHHPERQMTSFFVEKLLDLDQAPESTSSILGRMVESGEELDMKVFATLRKQIQGDTSTKPMDSSIRAAAHYVERSESTERAQLLIRHVCVQARSLQHSEGSAFVEFIESVLVSQGPGENAGRERRNFATQSIPLWAPYLLVYNDEQTRISAELVINDALFQPLLRTTPDQTDDNDGDDDGDDDANGEKISLLAVIRQVGIKCLLYLREVHVKRGVQLERNAASNISRVISKCAQFYGPTDGANDLDTESVEFAAIQAEIRSPMQRLLVDEVDDDGSDWDGSCGSSELIDDAGISMQTGHETND
ncbi:hypothetical protein C2857_001230 [Epichloe festucae Fl1]|uniref:USP domain-containing protein n=1 Tax=Epichloe festucae (strain Fl1) TaxID=877507 RepID=A0A7U3SNJ8_EPIFF|nr:hypothetical protein C2857_001230 [Epichloe festucae Fl1]